MEEKLTAQSMLDSWDSFPKCDIKPESFGVHSGFTIKKE
jgi:hypothetical protein